MNAKMEPKSYIHIDLIGRSETGKTMVFVVRNKKHGDVLGKIFWRGQWRQYVFEIESGTIWSGGCLGEIKDFLDNINAQHRDFYRNYPLPKKDLSEVIDDLSIPEAKP